MSYVSNLAILFGSKYSSRSGTCARTCVRVKIRSRAHLPAPCVICTSSIMMLRLSQRIVRPPLARALRVPAFTNSLHTLPDLPYAYDVRVSCSHTACRIVESLNFEPCDHITG